MNWFRRQDKKTENRHFEEELSAYLDGELPPREREAVERHLSTCPACRWHLETLRQTVQWTSELPTVRVPRTFAIPVPARSVPAARRRSFVPALQMATALVALLLVFAVAGDVVLTGFQPIGMPSSEPEALPSEATTPAQLAGAEAEDATEEVAETVIVETVMVEKEGEPLMRQEAPTEAPVVANTPAAVEAPAGVEDTATEEPVGILAVAPAEAATVTAEAAIRATMAPAGMGSGVEEVVEEGAPPPEAEGRAEATVVMEAPAVPPTLTAVPTVEPPATRLAMPPPSAQVEVGEAPSVPGPARGAEEGSGRRPAILIWLRWGEYILGVLLILLLGTTIGAMIWRWSRK